MSLQKEKDDDSININLNLAGFFKKTKEKIDLKKEEIQSIQDELQSNDELRRQIRNTVDLEQKFKMAHELVEDCWGRHNVPKEDCVPSDLKDKDGLGLRNSAGYPVAGLIAQEDYFIGGSSPVNILREANPPIVENLTSTIYWGLVYLLYAILPLPLWIVGSILLYFFKKPLNEIGTALLNKRKISISDLFELPRLFYKKSTFLIGIPALIASGIGLYFFNMYFGYLINSFMGNFKIYQWNIFVTILSVIRFGGFALVGLYLVFKSEYKVKQNPTHGSPEWDSYIANLIHAGSKYNAANIDVFKFKDERRQQVANALLDDSYVVKLGTSSGEFYKKGNQFSPDKGRAMAISIKDTKLHVLYTGNTGKGKTTNMKTLSAGIIKDEILNQYREELKEYGEVEREIILESLFRERLDNYKDLSVEERKIIEDELTKEDKEKLSVKVLSDDEINKKLNGEGIQLFSF